MASVEDGTYTWTEFARPTQAGGSTIQASCQFNNAIDSIHYSSTPPATLSVHGWWINVNCTKDIKAVVTTQLQKKNSIGLWVDVGSRGVKTVYSGGGSANRSTSRYACTSGSAHSFRAWVDVDVVGIPDLPDKYYHPEASFPCN
ncbi:hypothetical protein FBY24_2023 [Cellulomonas sp. SLBN-39]|nr:hypothetical protein FBY24_2023 [Cellulomonas sp. SLBN-39]